MIAVWLTGQALAGLCADDTAKAVEDAIAAADEAYGLMDELAFDRAAKALDANVACLDVVPPPSTLARIHRTMALISLTGSSPSRH